MSSYAAHQPKNPGFSTGCEGAYFNHLAVSWVLSERPIA